MKTSIMVLAAVAAIAACAGEEELPTDSGAGSDGGVACEGEENECGGCGEVVYESQSVPIGQPCVYFWTEDNAGDCGTVGVGACTDSNTVACSAPKPDCAP